MQHIDKSSAIFSAQFNNISNRLIAQGKTNYKDLDDNDRSDLRNILRNEQNGYCAYCMEYLPNGTNEHVIPRSAPQREFRSLLKNGRYRQDMVHTKSWSANVHINGATVTHYPHHIAYGNMVLACSQCNSRRDTNKIKPTFFDNPTGVSYEADGKVNLPADALCLKLRTYLNEACFKEWRKLWSQAKNAGVTDAEISAADTSIKRNEIMCRILGVAKLNDRQMRLLIKNNWDRFVSYRWFYSYY